MTIYLIQNLRTKNIKVGYTDEESAKNRLQQLQTGHCDELVILLTFPGDRRLEQKLHKKLFLYHIRGEWFTSDILKSEELAECLEQEVFRIKRQKEKEKPELKGVDKGLELFFTNCVEKDKYNHESKFNAYKLFKLYEKYCEENYCITAKSYIFEKYAEKFFYRIHTGRGWYYGEIKIKQQSD
jgi:hypothetical protein